MARLIDDLTGVRPVAAVVRLASAHPRQAAWLGLSTVLCVVLAVAGCNADLPLRSWLALFAVGILTAGACTLIVSGDSREASSPRPAHSAGDATPPAPDPDPEPSH